MMSCSDAMTFLHQSVFLTLCNGNGSSSIFYGIFHLEYTIIQVMPKIDQAVAKIDQAVCSVNHSCIADCDDLSLTTWVPEVMLTRIENIDWSDVSDRLTDCASSTASRMT